MSLDRNFKTYKVIDIQQRRSDLIHIPQELKTLSVEIAKTNQTIESLQKEESHFLATEINPLNEKIKLYQARVNTITLPQDIAQLEKEIKISNNTIENLVKDMQSINEKIDNYNEILRLSEFKRSIKQAINEKESYTLNIQNLNKSLAARMDRYNELNLELDLIAAQINLLQTQIKNSEQPLNDNGFYSSTQSTSPNNGYYTTQNNDTTPITKLLEQLELLRSKEKNTTMQLKSYDSEINNLKQKINSAQSGLENKNNFLASIKPSDLTDAENITFFDLNSLVGTYTHRKNEALHSCKTLNTDLTNQKISLENKTRTLNDKKVFLSECQKSAAPLMSETDVVVLLKQLNEYQNTLADKTLILNGIQNNLATANNTATQLHSRHQKASDLLNKHINNIFLKTLDTNPRDLIKNIIKQTQQKLLNFDYQTPEKQSEAIRISILEINEKLLTLDNQIKDFNGDAGIVDTYYAICGLLWQNIRKLENTPNDYAFVNILLSILKEHPLDETEALLEFQKSSNNNPALARTITSDNLKNFEDAEFNTQKNSLEVTLESFKNHEAKEEKELIDSAYNVIQSIEEYKKSSKENFDSKLYSFILVTINQLVHQKLTHQPTAEAQKHYHDLLLKVTDGQPSLAKKVNGAILGLLGIANAITNYFTDGFYTHSEVAKKSIYGASAAPLLTGLGLFYLGCERNTYKQMNEFEKKVKQQSEVENNTYYRI